MQRLGVINERPDPFAVPFQKMFGRVGNRRGHSLPDGNRRNHDDELAPAVPFVQLEDGLDVAVGFPGAGLHLHIQVHRTHLGLLQRIGDREILAHLHGLNVLQDCLGRQQQITVPKTRVHLQPRLLAGRHPAGIDPVTQAGLQRLAIETIHHGFHSLGLVALNFESELHRFLCFFSFCRLFFLCNPFPEVLVFQSTKLFSGHFSLQITLFSLQASSGEPDHSPYSGSAHPSATSSADY